MDKPNTPRKATAAELKFIDQMTRKLMVNWADQQARYGEVPDLPSMSKNSSSLFYVDYARSKGWISKKDNRVLATGFATAASFLKR